MEMKFEARVFRWYKHGSAKWIPLLISQDPRKPSATDFESKQ